MLYLELSNGSVLRWRVNTRFPVIKQLAGIYESQISIVGARADQEELEFLKQTMPELFEKKARKVVIRFCRDEAEKIYEKWAGK